MQDGSCHRGVQRAPHCAIPFQPHSWVPWRVHATGCRLPVVPWPGCFLCGMVLPAGTMSLFSAGDEGAELHGRSTPHLAHAFCGDCVPQSTVGIRKYLRLETGFLGVWSTWQALPYICLTFRKGSRGILPPGTLWLSSGTSTRLTWGTSCCKAQSRFSADLGLCRDYLCCCLGYLMDALEKLPGDLQEQSTHAALPIEEGSRQWRTGIDRRVPRKSVSQLKGSPCEACS